MQGTLNLPFSVWSVRCSRPVIMSFVAQGMNMSSPQFEAQIIADDQQTVLCQRVLVTNTTDNDGTFTILSSELFRNFSRVYLAFPINNPIYLIAIDASYITSDGRTVVYQIDRSAK